MIALLAVVPDTVAGRRDRALLLVFILTGRRRSEVISLTAGDISVDGETAFYSYRGKGGKRGRRELPRPAYNALCATLVDAGISLAEMDPGASLWQAGAGRGRSHRFNLLLQSLVVAIFARLDVLGFKQLEYELTPDAIDLGLDATLPPVIDLASQIGEFGRGERI